MGLGALVGFALGSRRMIRGTVTFDWTDGFEQFDDFFQGYIAEVRFWDGARTPEEVAETYKTRMTPGLAASWRVRAASRMRAGSLLRPVSREDASLTQTYRKARTTDGPAPVIRV